MLPLAIEYYPLVIIFGQVSLGATYKFFFGIDLVLEKVWSSGV